MSFSLKKFYNLSKNTCKLKILDWSSIYCKFMQSNSKILILTWNSELKLIFIFSSEAISKSPMKLKK
jgi:hypothetical protein